MTHVQLDNCDILIMVVEQLVLKDVLYCIPLCTCTKHTVVH